MTFHATHYVGCKFSGITFLGPWNILRSIIPSFYGPEKKNITNGTIIENVVYKHVYPDRIH